MFRGTLSQKASYWGKAQLGGGYCSQALLAHLPQEHLVGCVQPLVGPSLVDSACLS